jgi:mannosylglycerate hydrolase MGH1-like protein
VEALEPELLERMPSFARRMRWFLHNRPQLAGLVASWEEPGVGRRRLLALVHGHRMKRLLERMLDPDEFLSPHGVRALSRHHLDHPYSLVLDGTTHTVDYEPAESRTGLFGGNSNWRGPIWFPINYLLIEALQKFHHYYGDDFVIEAPTGSGHRLTLREIGDDLATRLTRIFLADGRGRRPVFGDARTAADPQWRDNLLFYEYFNGDTGAGLGASHQAGWTALVAKLLDQLSRR